MTPQDNNIIISVEDLKKIYQLGSQEVKALNGVSFDIKRNEFLAIMGPSGSGKSTLMNIIGCLDTPSEGTYFLNGKEVSSFSENELAYIRNQEIGFVFQVFNLLSRTTAFHNVELPLIYKGTRKKMREEQVKRALKMVSTGPPEGSPGRTRPRLSKNRRILMSTSLVGGSYLRRATSVMGFSRIIPLIGETLKLWLFWRLGGIRGQKVPGRHHRHDTKNVYIPRNFTVIT